MIEIATQYINGCYVPVALEDQRLSRANHVENQIIRAKLAVVQNPRSIKQLRLYWQCCRMVAENHPHPDFKDKDSVDFHTRISLQFFDKNRCAVRDDTTYLALKSIAFDNLNQAGMNDYMNEAMELHAIWLGIPAHQLALEAERQGARMVRYTR